MALKNDPTWPTCSIAQYPLPVSEYIRDASVNPKTEPRFLLTASTPTPPRIVPPPQPRVPTRSIAVRLEGLPPLIAVVRRRDPRLSIALQRVSRRRAREIPPEDPHSSIHWMPLRSGRVPETLIMVSEILIPGGTNFSSFY